MTDKEKAEEYVLYIPDTVDAKHSVYSEEKLKQAYLDGLEAGKPKWHDLRKDPNDVPTEKGDYWVIDADGDYSSIYVPVAVKHCNDADMYKALNIVAWCELPKFEG